MILIQEAESQNNVNGSDQDEFLFSYIPGTSPRNTGLNSLNWQMTNIKTPQIMNLKAKFPIDSTR